MCLQVLVDLLLYGIGTMMNGEPIINLPPKSIFLKKVDFSPEERSFYLRLEADSRQQFKVLVNWTVLIYLAIILGCVCYGEFGDQVESS